jgi:hypothetical protein
MYQRGAPLGGMTANTGFWKLTRGSALTVVQRRHGEVRGIRR